MTSKATKEQYKIIHTNNFYDRLDLDKLKRCSICGEELPLSDFGRHRKTKDGFYYCCKKCRIKSAKKLGDKYKVLHTDEWYALQDLSKLKHCPRCHEELPLRDFYRELARKDGFSCWCKKCGLESSKKVGNKNKVFHTSEWYTKQDLSELKRCSVCLKELPLKAFYRDPARKDGFTNDCKQCISREPYKIFNTLKQSSLRRGYGKLPFTLKKFKAWYKLKEKKCTFCEVEENLLKFIDYIPKDNRRRLEVERIDNERGYALDNMTLTCHNCNQYHKFDVTFEDAMEYGQKKRKPRWQKILRDKGISFKRPRLSVTGV